MSSDVAALCCCDAGLGDCCDFWNQCDPALPTTLTITLEERVTRYYAGGASIVLAESLQTWTVTDWTRSQSAETVCDPVEGPTAADFYFTGGTVTWSIEASFRWPIVRNALSYGSLTCPGYPPPVGCSGCDEDYGCREEDPDVCESGRLDYSAEEVIPDYEAEFGCVVEDGCVRPTISFAKVPLGGEVLVAADSVSFVPGCCNPDPATTDQFTIGFAAWGLKGACGCPSGKSWLAPIGSPPSAIPLGLFTAAGIAIACGFGPSLNGSWQSDEVVETLTWFCQCDFVTPGGGSIYNECTMEVRWSDVCERTVTVSIA
jgi:hypothetical protein